VKIRQPEKKRLPLGLQRNAQDEKEKGEKKNSFPPIIL